MSAEARRNGWVGFDVAERVHGGYMYRCDGMPTMMGCGAEITVPRKWTRVGRKKSGWLVCFGLDSIDSSKPIDDPENQVEDEDIVLTFCPRCADHVEAHAQLNNN